MRLLRRTDGHLRGVTLVEMMVVVVIIGILAAAATPTLKRTQRRSAARSLASDIANDLRTARNQAMSRGEAIYVRITPGDGSDINRGRVETFRMPERCPDGTSAGSGCGAEEPRRPRNCREFIPATEYIRVVDTVLSQKSGSARIVGFEPANDTLCFSPDGRVLSVAGNALNGGTVPCQGENYVIWTADKSVSDSEAQALATCGASSDDRYAADLYRITVPFNGAIDASQ